MKGECGIQEVYYYGCGGSHTQKKFLLSPDLNWSLQVSSSENSGVTRGYYCGLGNHGRDPENISCLDGTKINALGISNCRPKEAAAWCGRNGMERAVLCSWGWSAAKSELLLL